MNNFLCIRVTLHSAGKFCSGIFFIAVSFHLQLKLSPLFQKNYQISRKCVSVYVFPFASIFFIPLRKKTFIHARSEAKRWKVRMALTGHRGCGTYVQPYDLIGYLPITNIQAKTRCNHRIMLSVDICKYLNEPPASLCHTHQCVTFLCHKHHSAIIITGS